MSEFRVPVVDEHVRAELAGSRAGVLTSDAVRVRDRVLARGH
jgi:hypothetical protein